MSPLGWQVSRADTNLARAAGRFKDPRSRMDKKGYAHLEGEDKTELRRKLFVRSMGYCEIVVDSKGRRCGRFAGWENGQMHHIPGGYEKIDDLAHVWWACKPCHKSAHVAVRWTKRVKNANT